MLVLASPSNHVALYIGRERKGHKGTEGTPLEDYVGTVVHLLCAEEGSTYQKIADIFRRKKPPQKVKAVTMT